jgi:signal transduction histidine kinase
MGKFFPVKEVLMIRTLKQIAFDLRLKIGYSSAFILLLLSYILTLYGNKQLINQSGWVSHTNKSINSLEVLLSGIKDAETGVRGYINTRDSSFLKPYANSFAAVDSSFNSFKIDTRDNKPQHQDLVTLYALIKKRYEKLDFAIAVYPKSGYIVTDTLLQSFYAGRVIMDSIRLTVSNMQKREKNVLTTRTKELDTRYKALNIIIITSLLVAVVFALFGFFAYRTEVAARKEADHKITDYQNELKQRIVELDTANKELVLMKQSEKFAATGRIARTIAHEVRNPLTNIDLAMSQIKNDIPYRDESTSMLFTMVERNSRRINQLISELLSATRFAELIYTSVSINELMDQALALAKDRIDLNHITVTKNYGADICNLLVDAEKIKIAFLNLIVNAIEAVEPGKGLIGITTKMEDNRCVVTISDNGHGMSEEQLNNLFEPYFTTKSNGNGLGLTNTQNIILNHRGSVNVNSKPAHGTSFTIKFDFAS